MEKHEIIIVGAGAAGLACAAKLKGRNFALLEAQAVCGRKVLASGNGRCNVTNKNLSPKFYGGNKKIVESVLARFGTTECIKFFETLGVMLREEEGGRYFPVTGKAAAVAGALAAASAGHIVYGARIIKIEKKDLFELTAADNRIFTAEKIVLACGSPAYPQLGANPSGYELAEMLGHKIITPRPSLTGINLKNAPLKKMQGVRAQASISFDGQTETGEIMFTAAGISGLPAQNLSRAVNKTLPARVEISINFFPQFSAAAFKKIMLKRRENFGERKLADFFTGILHEDITAALLENLKLAPAILAGRMKIEEFDRLAAAPQNWVFEAGPARDWQDSFCAAGGVDGAEIYPQTFESKKCRGLYIIGETADADGKSGGYNLHFAFGSGYLAAEDI
ncbi:MAG: aminoacetone oxidase family FAD-binding enzyme [Elusimicrobium sp.]|jgi:predicted Rossmann fold flavoprotein|nr:aminoacetone oxidase family FAD-binding enzyme [Elusimicrobium sp.]